MALRDFGTDEALEKYEKEKGTTEKSGEGWKADRTEFEAVQKEKKLRKPGAVSRFFNQFGIGKYWERMNDYFEQEEKMEKEAAEKAAAKETVSDVKVAAEEEVQEVKKTGAEMPAEIQGAAARAGAEEETAAPMISEAQAEETAIEEEAEAAKANLDKEVEDVEIVEKESMEDETRRKYRDAPMREIDVKIKNLESDIKREANPDLKDMFEAERDILARIKKEKMPAKVEGKKRKEGEVPAWDEVEEIKKVKPLGAEDLPPIEEFEAVAKEHEEQEVPSPEKVKAVDILEEEVEEPAEEEMAKAKVEVKSLKNKKTKEEPEEISIDFDFKRGDKVQVIGESGKVDPGWTLVSFGKDKKTAMVTKPGKDGQPMLKTIDLEELKQWKRDEEFFGKGKKESRKKMWRGVKTLTKARGEYAAQRQKKAEEAFKIAEPEIKEKPKPKKIKLKIAS